MNDKIKKVIVKPKWNGGVELWAWIDNDGSKPSEAVKIEGENETRALAIFAEALNAHGFTLERGARQEYRRVHFTK